jgi:hypothetical protein
MGPIIPTTNSADIKLKTAPPGLTILPYGYRSSHLAIGDPGQQVVSLARRQSASADV